MMTSGGRGRPVIKAVNNIYAQHLLENGKPAGASDRKPEWSAKVKSPAKLLALAYCPSPFSRDHTA